MTDHAATARQILALTDGHAASADSLAAIATAHALLAIADRLNPPQPPAGTCTAIITTGYDVQPYEGCDHPHGHTGAHRSTNDGDIRWTDQSPGAGHINTPAHIAFDYTDPRRS